jgi:hypothetical protein
MKLGNLEKTLILFSLLGLLAGCAGRKHISLEDAIPKIESQNTLVLCDPQPVKTLRGKRWDTLFYAWNPTNPKKNGVVWFSQEKDYMKAAKVCTEFYRVTDEMREDLRSKNEKIIPAKPCNIKHEPIDLEEIFPKTDQPYPFFRCRVEPIGDQRHFRNRFLGGRNYASKISEVDWEFFSPTLYESHIEAARDCYEFYKLVDVKWKKYKKENPHLFRDGKLLVKEMPKIPVSY